MRESHLFCGRERFRFFFSEQRRVRFEQVTIYVQKRFKRFYSFFCAWTCILRDIASLQTNNT